MIIINVSFEICDILIYYNISCMCSYPCRLLTQVPYQNNETMIPLKILIEQEEKVIYNSLIIHKFEFVAILFI